ncbi:hypothetical protein MCEMSEM18_03603 [Comamonadaceae bacterium]
MKIFEFGTGPQATALGYYLDKLVHKTDADLQAAHATENLIFVRGPTVQGQTGVFEFALFKPVQKYMVRSLLASPDWIQKAQEACLKVHSERPLFSERYHIVRDASDNRVTLTQANGRDIPLDAFGLDDSRRAILYQLHRAGLLSPDLPKGRCLAQPMDATNQAVVA